ncbi:MAG: hypothetical protein HYS74_01235 [Parcubacteria group bacterium]|nr:hypothetical protein [Parcubacteria group bacterium]
MPQYSVHQIETLRELRAALAEQSPCLGGGSFAVFNLRTWRRKHPLEFVFASPDGGRATSAIARLYHGRVRVQFFHGIVWPGKSLSALKRRFGNGVLFATLPLNPTRKGNFRLWEEYADADRQRTF